jgi:hypothetical protein
MYLIDRGRNAPPPPPQPSSPLIADGVPQRLRTSKLPTSIYCFQPKYCLTSRGSPTSPPPPPHYTQRAAQLVLCRVMSPSYILSGPPKSATFPGGRYSILPRETDYGPFKRTNSLRLTFLSGWLGEYVSRYSWKCHKVYMFLTCT